ncbi:MAG: hypothetical protein GXO89_06305 [Chlorobi bacterium]|nr:hypothetical protein [Chlorobiota bacterium]
MHWIGEVGSEDFYGQASGVVWTRFVAYGKEWPGWEAYTGAAVSVGSEMFFSKTYGTWMGNNFKMYKQNFHGNGSVGGMNKFGKTTSNAFKWGGRLVGAYSGYKTIEKRVNDEIGTVEMSAELGTTSVSTFGGLYGAAWGVGWEMGRAVTNINAYQEFKFNYWYSQMKKILALLIKVMKLYGLISFKIINNDKCYILLLSVLY